jgi:hypothetical protein
MRGCTPVYKLGAMNGATHIPPRSKSLPGGLDVGVRVLGGVLEFFFF